MIATAESTAFIASNPGSNTISSILTRLSNIERCLGMIKPVPHTGDAGTDIAEMRSLLAPTMHITSRTRLEPNTSWPSPGSLVDGSQNHQPYDAMHTLSLRRDLSHPENPPFGTWWTYTVEETLLWPILEYNGNINSNLDLILGDFGDENSDEDGYESSGNGSNSSLKKRRRFTFGGARKGLDDGTLVPELIESFLRNVHTKFPILSPKELQARASSLVENGLDWDGETCQVLLACALGAISSAWDPYNLNNYDRRRPSSDRYSMARAYFSAGQKRLGVLCAQSSLIAAQCLFMAGTFLLYLQKPVEGWRLLNIASTACRAFASKRIARENQGKNVDYARSMEERLCWSCFKAEREVACEFGMETSSLNVIANSTSLPTPPNGYACDMVSVSQHDRSSSNPPVQLPVAHEPYEDQSWYYFLTEIMLRKLEMRIDNFFQDKRREAYRLAGSSAEAFFHSLTETLQEFLFQLSSYYESLPPVMRFPLDSLAPCEDELRQCLRWRLYCVKHDLSLPALYILLHNDVSAWSRPLIDKLIELSNASLKVEVMFLKTAVTAHRHHNTWLDLRKGIRSALVLIAARRLCSQHRPGLEGLQVPDDETFRDGAQRLVRGLKYWSKESRDCASSLKILADLHPYFKI